MYSSRMNFRGGGGAERSNAYMQIVKQYEDQTVPFQLCLPDFLEHFIYPIIGVNTMFNKLGHY